MLVSYRRCRKIALRPVLSSLVSFLALVILLFLSFDAPAFAQEKSKAEAADSAPSKVDRLRRNRTQNLKPILHADKDKNGDTEQAEGSEFLSRRQDWFFKPRAFPLGFIPQGARERALQHKIQMYQREGRFSPFAPPSEGLGFLAPPSGTSSAWFAIGPQPTISSSNPPFTSGRVTALAVNPNNANNVFLGGADGGLWITTDGGATWTPLTDNPPNAANIPTVAVGSIALDPTTCGSGAAGICTTVYVGTGEDNFGGDNIYGEGILNCTVTAGTPPTAACTQDTTFHTPGPLDSTRGGPMIGALAVNRAAGKNNILLAGIRGRGAAIPSGVYCSADKGVTWTRVLPVALTNGAGTPGTDVAFASDGTAWAALSFFVPSAGSGIYKSSVPVSSCTITFNQQTLPTGFTSGASGNVGRITLALAPSSDATIYAAIADSTSTSSNLLGVVRSTNANTTTPTWTKLTAPLVSADSSTNTSFCSGQCFYDIALSVDPVNPAVVYAGGSGAHPIVRTTTATSTATFADVSSGTVTGSAIPHVDTHAFAFAADGSKIWVGNDGGVWSSATPSASLSWINLNGPSGTSTGALNVTQFYPGVSIHPSNPGFAMAGSQDNGIQVDQAFQPTPLAQALGWRDAGLGCDGGFTIIDPTVPTTSYGECEYLANRILVIGVTFAGDGLIGNGFLAVSGIDDTDRGNFIPPLVVDTSSSQTLYFGTCRVWQTKDGANSWAAISPDVTVSTHPAGCAEPTVAGQPSAALNAIVVAPSDSNTIYVGSDQGEIEVTSNGGTNWASIVTSTLPTRAVTQVVVDPSSKDTAYATFSGFGSCNNSAVVCDGKGHVFKTVNGTSGAAVWADVSGNLPDIPVNALVIDPDDPAHNTLYAGTDVGAFFTPDGGVTWSPLGASNSMPNAQILSLTLHNPSRTLRAATHGRGVWDLNLGAGASTASFRLSAISPLSTTAPGAAFTLNVQGTGFTATSAVLWNGSARTTTFNSATSLSASITAADVAAGAVISISVKDGANTTNSLPFVVLANTPTLTSISPTSTPVQIPPANNITLTLAGTGFSSTSQVTFNGSNTGVTVTAQTATQLTATLDKSLLGPFGSTNDINVANQPGNQFSAAQTFTVVAPPPANDNFANAISVTSTTFTDTQDSSGATTQSADPTPSCSQISGQPATGRVNTIWYKVVPSGTGTARIDTVGSSYDSVLSVWSGTSQTALASVACNDDITQGVVTQSRLTGVTLNAGTTYYIMVSSFGALDPNPVAFGGKSVLNFSFTGGIGGTSPDFTMTPQAPGSVTVSAGSPATYTVAIAGTNGFTGNVAVSCSLSAAATTCAANPASVAAGTNTTITVTTTAHQMLPPGSWPLRLRPWPRSLPVLLVAALLMLLARIARLRRQRLAVSLPLAGIILFLVLQAVGCSGGSGGGGTHGTQAGTYTVTITGTANGTTHTTTVSLTVN